MRAECRQRDDWMTEFERDILKRVLDSSGRTQHIDIESITDITQARTLMANFRKDPDAYRDKKSIQSIPIQSLKGDIDKFWDRYINGGEL